jgi:1-acyl-sn-glycerol-3-phosphate acyltransferase
MALEVGCPVIPTGLTGTRELLPKDAKVPNLGPTVSVKYGRPMRVPPEAQTDARALRGFTDDLMQAIRELTGQVYRDRYAYTKRIGQAGPALPVTAP